MICFICGSDQELKIIKNYPICQTCRKTCAISIMIEFDIQNSAQIQYLMDRSSEKTREALVRLFTIDGDSKMSEATFKRCQHYHQPCTRFDCAFCNWKYQIAYKEKYIY